MFKILTHFRNLAIVSLIGLILTWSLPVQADTKINPQLEQQVLEIIRKNPEIIIKSMGTTFSSVPEFNKPEFCLVLKDAMARLARVLVLEYTDADLLENLKTVFDPKTRIYTQHLLQEENTILLSNSVSMHS